MSLCKERSLEATFRATLACYPRAYRTPGSQYDLVDAAQDELPGVMVLREVYRDGVQLHWEYVVLRCHLERGPLSRAAFADLEAAVAAGYVPTERDAVRLLETVRAVLEQPTSRGRESLEPEAERLSRRLEHSAGAD